MLYGMSHILSIYISLVLKLIYLDRLCAGEVVRSIWGNAYLVRRGLSSQHPATHHLITSWTSPPDIR